MAEVETPMQRERATTIYEKSKRDGVPPSCPTPKYLSARSRS